MTMNLTEHPNPLTAEQSAASVAARRRGKDMVAAMLADWSVRWPAVFSKPVPLAIGSARQIRAALQGTGATYKGIGLTIHRWTMQSDYLRAVMRGEARRNLEGAEAGVPDDAAREYARKLLEERAIRKAAEVKRRQDRQSESRVAEQGGPASQDVVADIHAL